MRTLVAIIIVLLMAASACAAKPRESVASITVFCPDSTAYGSGVLISASGTEAIVLTNWHVVRPPRKSISVRWPDGKTSPGNVVAADSTWDLAAVHVERPAARPVRIAKRAPRRGERLTIAGYGPGPYLEQAGPTLGYMAPSSRHAYELVEMQSAARHGDSGGPILNEDGELAGVLYGTYSGRTVGPCCTRVAEFLDDVGLAVEDKP